MKKLISTVLLASVFTVPATFASNLHSAEITDTNTGYTWQDPSEKSGGGYTWEDPSDKSGGGYSEDLNAAPFKQLG